MLIEIIWVQMLIMILLLALHMNKNEIKNKINEISFFSLFTKKERNINRINNIVNIQYKTNFKDSLMYKILNNIFILLATVFKYIFRLGKKNYKNNILVYSWFSKKTEYLQVQDIPLYKNSNSNKIKNQELEVILNRNRILKTKIMFKIKKIERKIKKKRSNYKLFDILETDEN